MSERSERQERFMAELRGGEMSAAECEYDLVWGHTDRVCATYDTSAEAEESLAWYDKTFGPLHGQMFIRERPTGCPPPESSQ